MSDLGPLTPGDTYGNLLQMTGGVASGVLTQVQDGAGHTTSLWLDDAAALVDGQLTVHSAVILEAISGPTTYRTALARAAAGPDNFTVFVPDTMPMASGQVLGVTSIGSNVCTTEWVNGSVLSGNLKGVDYTQPVSAPATINLTLSSNEYQWIDTTITGSGTINVNLPASPAIGQYFRVKNHGGGVNNMNIKSAGTTIDTLSGGQNGEYLVPGGSVDTWFKV